MGRRSFRISGRLATVLILVIVIIAFYKIRSLYFGTEEYPVVDATYLPIVESTEGPASYSVQLAQWGGQLPSDAKPVEMTIAASQFTTAAPNAKVSVDFDRLAGKDVLTWNNGAGWVEWEFHVPVAGQYDIVVDYMPLPGEYTSIIRGIQIDGEYPFYESERLTFKQYRKIVYYPYERNKLGNEVRAAQVEIKGWKRKALSDNKVSSEPLHYDLSEGKHTLRMIGISQPMALSSLSIVTSEALPSYTQYVSAHPAAKTGAPPWNQIVEAEAYTSKSEIGIQKLVVQEAGITPDPKGRIVYNALGAERWQVPGQWVEWTINIPEDGWYGWM